MVNGKLLITAFFSSNNIWLCVSIRCSSSVLTSSVFLTVCSVCHLSMAILSRKCAIDSLSSMHSRVCFSEFSKSSFFISSNSYCYSYNFFSRSLLIRVSLSRLAKDSFYALTRSYSLDPCLDRISLSGSMSPNPIVYIISFPVISMTSWAFSSFYLCSKISLLSFFIFSSWSSCEPIVSGSMYVCRLFLVYTNIQLFAYYKAFKQFS